MGFLTIFLFSGGLLTLLISSAVLLPAPWAWLLGPLWIAYDTWLGWHHTLRGRLAIARPALVAPPSAQSPSLCVLIAAHNEAAGILACVAALTPEPGDHILVLDDGSTDDTAERVVQAYALTWASADTAGVRCASSPTCAIRVLSQPRAGKARALNRGLMLATHPVVVTLDADTIAAPGALSALRATFATDPTIDAACGILEPTGTKRWWAWSQRREYARAFVWRAGWAADGMLVLVPGAFAAYRRERLSAIGGFDADSLVEDYEVMYRLNRAQPNTRAVVVAGARASTDVPITIGAFLRQRQRWFGGFIMVLWHYRALVGSAVYGPLGRWHLRLKTVDTLLPLYGLAAVATFIFLWWRDGTPGYLILCLLGCKMLLDAVLHAVTARSAAHWLGSRPTSWLIEVSSSLVEQLTFQPLRHLGAALGWVVVARRTRTSGQW